MEDLNRRGHLSWRAYLYLQARLWPQSTTEACPSPSNICDQSVSRGQVQEPPARDEPTTQANYALQ
jgi:hypothetical protein